MITNELLAGNELLNALPDDVKAAICTLSKNDENTVLGKRIGELHGQYDKDFEEVLGISKPSGEKSYSFWKAQMQDLKKKAEKGTGELQTQLDTATARVAELEKQIKEAAPEATKAQIDKLTQDLADERNTVKSLREDMTTKESEYKQSLADKEQEYHTTMVNGHYSQLVGGLKFKAGTDEAIINAMVKTAIGEAANIGKAEFMDNEDGTKKIIFRGEDGNVITNKDNLHNPLTGQEVIAKHLAPILKEGQNIPGGGTKPPPAGGGGSGAFDKSAYPNRQEAEKALKAQIVQSGIARTDAKRFNAEFQKLHEEYDLMSMPVFTES